MINDYFFVQLRQSVNVLFPLTSTEEVISLTYGEVCPVPGVSSALLGVANQRGKLLWVLDLSDLLQISSEQTRPQDNLTLLVLNNSKNSGQQIGCVVSALKGIIPLDLALQSLSISDPGAEYLGVRNIIFDDEKYAVIDVKSILNNIYNLIPNNKLVQKS